MGNTNSTKKVLPAIAVVKTANWRDDLQQLVRQSYFETALLLSAAALDERRELYRLLKETPVVSIPYVQLPYDAEEWELAYLNENYGSEVFGLTAQNKAFSLLARLSNYLKHLAFENPEETAHQDLFTDEALTRSGIGRVCLDAKTLEQDRRSNPKKYNLTIHALDHHQLVATKIGPVAGWWFKKIAGGNGRRLTSLKDLNYLKHLPPSYMAPLLILAMDNTIDEQKEIKAYIELLLQ